MRIWAIVWLLLAIGSALAQPGPQAGSASSIMPGANLSSGNVTTTGASTARSLAAKSADVHNALDFGATGNGTTDDTAAINAALAADASGIYHNVYLPPGTYRITNALTVSSGRVGGTGAVIGQCLFSDNKSMANIQVSYDFNGAATAPIVLTGNAYGTPCVESISINFNQPSQTAVLSAASISGTSLTATIVSGTPANGNMLIGTGVNSLTTLSSVSIVGSALTATVSVSQTVGSEAMTTNIGRANFGTLASGCGSNGTGCQYPPAIDYSAANNVHISDVFIGGSWKCIRTTGASANGATDLNNIQCGALNTGLDISNSVGIVYISNYHFYPWGMGGNNVVYNDGTTYAANFNNDQGITANNFFSQNGRLGITGAGSPAGFAHFTNLEMDLDSATIEISEANQWITIAGGYSLGSAIGGTSACGLNLSGASTVMVTSREFRNNGDSVTAPICVSSGILHVANSEIINYNLGGNAITQTGGVMELVNNQIAEGSVGTYTAPVINSTSGTYSIVGNTFGGFGGTATAISGTDGANNQVLNNLFYSGYTFIPPGPNGSYVGTSWASYTPTIGCQSGTLTSGTATGYYQRVGQNVQTSVAATITTVGTCTGLYFTTPVGGSGTIQSNGIGRDNITGATLLTFQQSGVIYLVKYDGTSDLANGNTPHFTLNYILSP